MIQLYVSGREFSGEELNQWCLERDLTSSIVVIDSIDNGTWYNVAFVDQQMAIEFRLTFDAQMGVKKSFEEDLIEILSAEIAKEIDEQVLAELIKLAA